MRKCFDAKKYLKVQKEKILERIEMFDKLYLEFGGKLIDDQHAARTLPGFLPDLKIRLLQEFKDEAEVILCINADAIEKSKIRADHMIPYETEVIRLIEFLREKGLFALFYLLCYNFFTSILSIPFSYVNVTAAPLLFSA